MGENLFNLMTEPHPISSSISLHGKLYKACHKRADATNTYCKSSPIESTAKAPAGTLSCMPK